MYPLYTSMFIQLTTSKLNSQFWRSLTRTTGYWKSLTI